MRKYLFTLLVLVTALTAQAADAQISVGIGGGGGVGSRGKPAKGTHGLVYAQFKLPILPGLRADGMAFDVPKGIGRFAVTGNIVLSLPVPVLTPYVIGGLGRYGLGKDGSVNGWNAGAGAKVHLMGIGAFAEFRHHQKVARNLLTVGLTL